MQGEEDSMLDGTGLTLKNNHQSLLREVTYDPRLGILIFSPIEELALLRKQVLASVSKPTVVADLCVCSCGIFNALNRILPDI